MEALRAQIGRYPHTRALFESGCTLSGQRSVSFVRTTPGSTARNMIRDLAYDICELPVVNYLAARQQGVGLEAIPVFLSRRFPHATIVCNRGIGVLAPRDLEGRRIGVGYYGNTDTTWAQGILSRQFDVELDSVTWVTSQEEQVPGAPLPEKYVNLSAKSETPESDGLPAPVLTKMLAAGELAAVIYGLPPSEYPDPAVQPLFGDLGRVEREWYAATGVFPVLHTVVYRSELAREHPSFPGELFDVFADAKEQALRRVEAGPLDEDERRPARNSGFPSALPPVGDHAYLGADAIPYGLAPNRANLEMLAEIAVERGVLRERPMIEGVFADVS